MDTSKIIEFFNNKKTTIATIISAVLVYALGRHYIAQDTAQLIADIMVALGLTANVVTARYYNVKEAAARMAAEMQARACANIGGGNEAAKN